MKKVEEKAYAKVNLVLNIGDHRPDGYHDIQTVMQSLELHDDVTVEQTGGAGVTVTTNVETIPTDENNLAVKAVKAFAAKTGVQADGLSIHIEKRIPVAAGLGGGSSDAAATLRALNQIYETNLSLDELAEIAFAVPGEEGGLPVKVADKLRALEMLYKHLGLGDGAKTEGVVIVDSES